MILCECFRIQMRLVPVPADLVALRIALAAPVAGGCGNVFGHLRQGALALACQRRFLGGLGSPRGGDSSTFALCRLRDAARSLGDRFDGGAIATEVAAQLFAKVFRDERLIHPLGQSTGGELIEGAREGGFKKTGSCLRSGKPRVRRVARSMVSRLISPTEAVIPRADLATKALTSQ